MSDSEIVFPVTNKHCAEQVKEFRASQGEILTKLDVVTKALTGNEDGTMKGINGQLLEIRLKQDSIVRDVAHIRSKQTDMNIEQQSMKLDITQIKAVSDIPETSTRSKVKKAAKIGAIGASGGGIITILIYCVQSIIRYLESQ